MNFALRTKAKDLRFNIVKTWAMNVGGMGKYDAGNWASAFLLMGKEAKQRAICRLKA